MDSLLADLRHGLRTLLRTRALSAVAILTIALGVGLTTHTFSVVYGTVLRGLDFDRGTRLVSLSQDIPAENSRGGGIPLLDVLDWREQQTAFRGVAAATMGTVNLADEGAPPERFDGAFVTANLFEQVDAVPILGRVFRPEEDAGVGEGVLILGFDVWQNRYGGSPDIVGTRIRANGEGVTVVGVMPEGFHFPFDQDVWLPLGIDPLEAERGGRRVAVVARLSEGVTLEQADAQMQGIARRIAAEHPETNEGVGVWVQPFEDYMMPPEIVAVMWVMLWAVFGVLLIACINVANLLLARTAVRSREVAVRAAMGADRARLIRQSLLEATILVVLGSLGGLVLAHVGILAFNASIVDIEKPYWIDIRLDGPALLFSVGVTALASLVAGALPALRASGRSVGTILKDQARGSSSFRLGRFSNVLVISEIALSCALLVGAGMMAKSVVNLKSLDMGFEGERVFTARLGLFESEYPDDGSRWRFYDRLLEDVRAHPDAEAAGLTQNLPALGSAQARVALEGVAYPDLRDQPISHVTTITPGYLEALGVAVEAGRGFVEGDRAGSLPVALVNRSFARKHFGRESPLGRRLRVGEDGPWLTIVGVVPDLYVGGDAPGGIGTAEILPDQFFRPLAQATGVRFVSVAVRTRGEPGAFAPAARSIVAGVDPDLPLYWVRSMDEAVGSATWAFGLFGSLFSIFGLAALFLAAVGLYGVMAFSVARRTREMGVRMALGARARSVVALVLGAGMKQMGMGTALGLALGAAMARPLAVIFYDVEPTDPLVYTAILMTLGTTGLLACLVPARRAIRVELVEALRPA